MRNYKLPKQVTFIKALCSALLLSSAQANEIINLSELNVESATYRGDNQDPATSKIEFTRGGNEVRLSNSAWKSFTLQEPITVTEQTILSFECKIEDVGEFIIVNLNNSSNINPGANNQCYYIGGTQSLVDSRFIDPSEYEEFGVEGLVDIGGGWLRFSIELHQNYGVGANFTAMQLAIDDDRASATGAVNFRNFRVYEGSDPGSFSTVVVNEDLWVNGNLTVEGNVTIQPQGDISMGVFGQ